jgi:hypothetical protein
MDLPVVGRSIAAAAVDLPMGVRPSLHPRHPAVIEENPMNTATIESKACACCKCNECKCAPCTCCKCGGCGCK